jgi:hypothetical protein
LIDSLLIYKNDIEPEEDLSLLTYHKSLLFAIYEDSVDVGHDFFASDALDGFQFFCDDVIQIFERERILIIVEDVESEKRESAFVKHEIVVVGWIFQ